MDLEQLLQSEEVKCGATWAGYGPHSAGGTQPGEKREQMDLEELLQRPEVKRRIELHRIVTLPKERRTIGIVRALVQGFEEGNTVGQAEFIDSLLDAQHHATLQRLSLAIGLMNDGPTKEVVCNWWNAVSSVLDMSHPPDIAQAVRMIQTAQSLFPDSATKDALDSTLHAFGS